MTSAHGAAQVVRLASPAFHYDPATRFFRKKNLPSKVGSLQKFVNGFKVGIRCVVCQCGC